MVGLEILLEDVDLKELLQDVVELDGLLEDVVKATEVAT